MSIVLKDGTVLPDIPSEYLGIYPYAWIVKMSGSYVAEMNGVTPFYMLVLTKGPMMFASLSGGNSIVCCNSLGGVNYKVAGSDWEFITEGEGDSSLPIEDYSSQGIEYKTEVAWSNHDIFIATSKNDDGTYEVGTEIYFHNSLSKPPFILPDGTELPPLPEGCFEKYPYGMISYVESTDGEAAYALSVAEGTYIFAPGSATGEGSDYVISLLPGYRHYRYVVAPTAASGWEQYAESTTQHSGHDFSREDGTIEIRWCNHDILTATAMNDDGTPEIGPDLYRKSDVNYRIYGGWLNSMGNQARRLGNVSGALKPGEMESVFSGATLETLTVTPTTEAQTFTPESPCIGFSVVTVEAAEKEIEYIEVEVIKEYPDAETTVFGNEYVTEEVPTGRYFYGAYLKSLDDSSSGYSTSMPPIPEISGYPYVVIQYEGYRGLYIAWLTSEPAYNQGDEYAYNIYHPKANIVQLNLSTTNGKFVDQEKTWEQAWTGTGQFQIISKCNDHSSGLQYLVWSNYNVMYGADGSGGLYYSASQPIPQTIGTAVTEPIEHPGDGMYQISGDTLNELVGLVQQLTGTTATTPGGAIDAMNSYLGNDTTE